MINPAPLVLFLLAACTPWPPSGHGGLAEAERGRPALIEDVRLTCARQQIETLTRKGGDKAFPAMLHVANLQWTRAARAQAGGMDIDAVGDLERFEAILTDLKGRLPEENGEILLSFNEAKGCLS